MKLAILILFLAVITNASAAEIYGKIYRWDTLEVVSGAVVEIRDGILQRMVAENGSYSFIVQPGNYTIIAYYRDYQTIEKVNVSADMRFDLILFPKLEEVVDIPEFPAVEEDRPYYLLAIFISGAIILFLYLIKARSKKTEFSEALPEELEKALEIIRKEGGRITQKELRKKLGYTEAKMSLIIADLERRGLVEKVKKGRGNIIFLKQS